MTLYYAGLSVITKTMPVGVESSTFGPIDLISENQATSFGT